MNIWFLIILVMQAMSLGMYLINHGEERTTKYNFWHGLIGFVLTMWLITMAIKTGF